MKKLLVCFGVLIVIHMRATESAGAAGQVERKTEAAHVDGRKINKEGTDELFALIQATDEKHPIDLNHVKQLIDEGADVNAHRENKLVLQAAIERDIFLPELYSLIINVPDYDKSNLEWVIQSSDVRIEQEERHLIFYSQLPFQHARRAEETLERNIANHQKIKQLLQKEWMKFIASIKQCAMDEEALEKQAEKQQELKGDAAQAASVVKQ